MHHFRSDNIIFDTHQQCCGWLYYFCRVNWRSKSWHFWYILWHEWERRTSSWLNTGDITRIWIELHFFQLLLNIKWFVIFYLLYFNNSFDSFRLDFQNVNRVFSQSAINFTGIVKIEEVPNIKSKNLGWTRLTSNRGKIMGTVSSELFNSSNIVIWNWSDFGLTNDLPIFEVLWALISLTTYSLTTSESRVVVGEEYTSSVFCFVKLHRLVCNTHLAIF